MEIAIFFLIALRIALAEDEKEIKSSSLEDEIKSSSLEVKQIEYDFILMHSGAFHGHFGEVNSYNGVCSRFQSEFIGECFGSLARISAL